MRRGGIVEPGYVVESCGEFAGGGESRYIRCATKQKWFEKNRDCKIKEEESWRGENTQSDERDNLLDYGDVLQEEFQRLQAHILGLFDPAL